MAARPALRLIDSHVHLWDRSRFAYPWIGAGSVLDRDWIPADFQNAIGELPVAGGVLIEAANTLDEIPWLVACAEELPGEWGVVGSLPLVAPDAPEQIARWAATPRLKGFRLNWTEPRAGGDRLRPAMAKLAEFGLSLDILCAFKQLPEIARFARDNEDVPIILDHFAGAPLGRNHLTAIVGAIEPFNQLTNVSVKVSGFASQATHCDVACLRAMLSLFDGVFGPGRMLFGSDFPISLVAHQYADVLSLAQDATADRDAFWRDALFSQSARTIYRVHDAISLKSRPS